MLPIVEGGLVAGEGASLGGRGCAGQLAEVVVVPRVGVDELVDVVVGAEVVDVLLAVEGGLVSVDRASRGCKGCAGQVGGVVVMPCVGEVQLVYVVVGTY